MENNQTELMAKAPVAKAIVKMSLPVILGMMVQVLYNLVDTFFIGMLKDEVQLAAANITTPIFMIQMAIATIVSTGAASFISRSIGEKNDDRANRTLTTGIVICTGLAIVLMAVGLLNLKSLITALGASAEVFPYASEYVGIMLLGSIPVMLNYAGGQLLRSEGAMMPSITGMMIGTVINVVLDPLFIFAFDMGIGGAAVATVLGNLGAAAYYGWYYLSGKALLKIRRKDVSRDKRIWKEIFTIGVPACMSQFLVSVAMIILNNQAKMYGDSVLAGMGISSKLMFIGTFVFMGFAAGCQPLIGYNYGANQFGRVREVFKTGMAMTVTVGLILLGVFWLLAPVLVGIFTPLEDVIKEGTRVFRISIFSFVVLGPQMLATTGIQAFGKAREALVLSLARQGLCYIPLLFIMQKTLGFEGLIWAQPVSDTVTLLLGIVFLWLILRKLLGRSVQEA